MSVCRGVDAEAVNSTTDGLNLTEVASHAAAAGNRRGRGGGAMKSCRMALIGVGVPVTGLVPIPTAWAGPGGGGGTPRPTGPDRSPAAGRAA
jgi:hypothetical protein